MDTEQTLHARSGSKCELCSAEQDLNTYEVPPDSASSADACVLICNTCREQIENPEKTDINHRRCLNYSMWNQTPAVQVLAWRMLNRLKTEGLAAGPARYALPGRPHPDLGASNE